MTVDCLLADRQFWCGAWDAEPCSPAFLPSDLGLFSQKDSTEIAIAV